MVDETNVSKKYSNILNFSFFVKISFGPQELSFDYCLMIGLNGLRLQISQNYLEIYDMMK